MSGFNQGIIPPFDIQVAAGLVDGWTKVNKFGRAPDGVQTTMTDIWDRADATPTQSVWTAPTAARTHTIVSTSNNDSDTGGVNPQSDGARTLRVFGLTDWDTAETSEDITLDGTTGVVTSNSYVIIHRMRVLTKGGNASGPNVGTITATATTDGTVTAQINPTEGQTQMAIYGIPSTQTAFMSCYYLSVHESGTPGTAIQADVELLVNPEPDAELTNFLIKHTQGIVTVGTSYFRHCFTPELSIPGPAIIKLQSISTAADTDASAGFDMYLRTN